MNKIDDIIFITKRYFFIDMFTDNCILNINLVKKQVDKNLDSDHEFDEFYNSICKRIKEFKLETALKGVLIDLDLGGYDAFSIAHHIRLDNNTKLQDVPIIITHNENIAISKSKYHNINDLGLLKNKAIVFELYQNLFNVDNLTEKMRVHEITDRFINEFKYDSYLKNTVIQASKTTSRHQIANEWGAFKLAYEAGFDISYNLPQTLHFKYLKAKYSDTKGINKGTPIFKEKLKVLFIDDNYDKGWKEALEKLLPADIDAFGDVLKAMTHISSDDYQKYNIYDVVFLDLYMPNNENVFEIETSKKLLNALKNFNPSISIIIFTASNKAWNLRKLTELGADGYFVKESPENASISNFSYENFNSFKETIEKTVEKSHLLRKYWEAIVLIKNNYLSEIIDKTNNSQDKYDTLFKSRIDERLSMFFGLLKQGLEQNRFNEENFFFSDYELAFMTLWSTLNEIQEAYYKKVHRNEQLTFFNEHGEISSHPNGRPINPIPGYNWRIKHQEQFLIKHEFELGEGEKNGFLVLKKSKRFVSCLGISNKEPYYETVDNSENSKISRELANQIAFLILNKVQLNVHEKKNGFLINLRNLNNIRNHLYLTHGEGINKGYFSKTEKEKREEPLCNINPEEDIKLLFELISFLLTGENNKITI